MMRLLFLIAAAMCAVLPVVPGYAVNLELKEVEIDRSPEVLRRGAAAVVNVCLNCHSLKYVKYRNLLDLGFTQAQVDNLRGGREMGGALLSVTPAEINITAYGIAPPDLSLMTRARECGPRYIYTLLSSFYEDKDGATNNRLFPGIKMPDVLGVGSIRDSGQRAEVDATLRSVAVFLDWVADPHAGARRRLGYYVIAYMVLLTSLLYLLKRRIWSRLDH